MLRGYTYRNLRRHLRMLAFGLLGMSVGALFMMRFLYVQSTFYVTDIGPLEVDVTQDVTMSGTPIPVRLNIPSVDIDAEFESPLGLQRNNEIEVPRSYQTVAYYKYGPIPGEVGPAVVLGHVDSYQGPAVLWNLRKVRAGDDIFIVRDDGSTAVFRVEKLSFPSQDAFPTEEVYGDIEYAGLRLITCSGKYDKGKMRYSNNLIVYARLVEIREIVLQQTT